MRKFWVYDIEIAENYFEIDLVNPGGEREACYVLNGKHYNTDMLHPLLCNDLMISEGNHLWGDIFLNYIWYHKEIVPSELYELSLEIKNNNVALYSYYMNLGVDSIDLLKITDYIELREAEWKDKLPFKIKGVEVIDYNLHLLCKKITKNYKKELQFRRDMTKACLTPKGKDEFDNFIFYYNVKDWRQSEV